MNHLEFCDKLNEFGIQIRSNKTENKSKFIEINSLFSEPDLVEIRNFKCEYVSNAAYRSKNALQAIISEAIDIDSWKHSIHNEISVENYENFREIIQDKIIKRASEIEMLLAVYFQLNHEISNNSYTK